MEGPIVGEVKVSEEDTRERVIRDLMKFPPVPSDDTLDESIETVFADAVAMGHKALANHYACAIANWNAAMDALDEARRERDDLAARLRAAERDRERWEEKTLHQIRRFRYLDDLLFVDTSVHPPVYMIGPIPMHDCPNPKDANVRAVVDAAIDRAMGGENDAQ